MTAIDQLLEGMYVVTATGTRKIIKNRPECLRLFGEVCQQIEVYKALYDPLMFVVGGAEGWDEIVAMACIETNQPYILIVPNPGYGEYYYSADHSQQGIDRRARFYHIKEHAWEVEVMFKQWPLYIEGRHVNMHRNTRMMSVSNEVWSLKFDSHEGGTKDGLAEAMKYNLALHWFS